MTSLVYARRKPRRSILRCEPLAGCVLTTAYSQPATAASCRRRSISALCTPRFRKAGRVAVPYRAAIRASGMMRPPQPRPLGRIHGKPATRLLGGDDHCRVADDPGVIGDEALNLRDAFLFGRVRAEISFQRLEEDDVGNVRRSRTSCRLRAGLRNARAKGKKFGRPR